MLQSGFGGVVGGLTVRGVGVRKRGREWVERIALERIHRLFELAEEEFVKGRKERANRYVELARKISTRNNATIPTGLKKRFCKQCGAFLKAGVNAELGLREKWVEIKCLECGFEFKRRFG